MILENKKEGSGLFKSVLLFYLILVLNLFLIAGVGILVLFFRGIVNYMLWIFLAGAGAIIFFGYRFYRRMKQEGKTLQEMVNSPWYRSRTVEVSFLGGLASLKLGRAPDMLEMDHDFSKPMQQLEDPETIRVRELTELVRLLEKNLITIDEYNKAKELIFKS